MIHRFIPKLGKPRRQRYGYHRWMIAGDVLGLVLGLAAGTAVAILALG